MQLYQHSLNSHTEYRYAAAQAHRPSVLFRLGIPGYASPRSRASTISLPCFVSPPYSRAFSAPISRSPLASPLVSRYSKEYVCSFAQKEKNIKRAFRFIRDDESVFYWWPRALAKACLLPNTCFTLYFKSLGDWGDFSGTPVVCARVCQDWPCIQSPKIEDSYLS